MFGTFRKHQKWIFGGALIIVIPSFVLFFSPNTASRGSQNQQAVNLGSIEGKPITREEYLPALNEIKLSYFIRSGGTWANDDATVARMKNDAMSRMLMIRLLDDYGIEVSHLAVASLARNQLKDIPLADFLERFLKPAGLTEQDYQVFLRHEAGIQQLVRVAALSGQLLNPREAETIFKKEHEQFITEAAVFSESNYLDKVTVTPALLTQAYTNRLQVYRTLDKIQISYVAFEASNYLEQADVAIGSMTNLTDTIDNHYLQRGADFFTDTNEVVLSEEDAKKEIFEDFRMLRALQEAEREANAFGSALFDMKKGLPNTAQDFIDLAAAQSLIVSVSPPFNRSEGLEDLNLPPAFRSQSHLLNTNNPVRVEPVVGANGAYVIAYKAAIKGTVPPYDEIKDKVEEDYKRQEARRLLRSDSRLFNTRLTNGLAKGTSFADLCTAAKVPFTSLIPFSTSSTLPLEGWDDRFSLQFIQRQIPSLGVGEATRLLPSAEGGYVVYLKERKPVETVTMGPEFTEFSSRLRQYKIGEAFNAWFSSMAEQYRLEAPRPPELNSTTAPAGGVVPSPGG